jgi:hypothetical protein
MVFSGIEEVIEDEPRATKGFSKEGLLFFGWKNWELVSSDYSFCCHQV